MANNITIDKIEKISEEDFNSVIVNSAAEWLVPLKARDILVNGLLKCENGVTCRIVRCMGTFKTAGDIHVDKIYCDGTFHADNSETLTFVSIFCAGIVKTTKDVNVEKVHINGTVNVTDGSLNADTINCSGAIICSESISANSIKSRGYVFAEKLRAKNIEIEYSAKVAQKVLKKKYKNAPIISEIEGDDIILQNVKAYKVKGKNITIKSGCSIDTIQYSGTLSVEDGAEIGNCEKIEEEMR